MTYDLRQPLDRDRFDRRVDALRRKDAVVVLTEKTQRTTSQNAYLHLLIGIVALDTGNTIDYCKEVYFKRLVNGPLFIEEKDDSIAGRVQTLRSSVDLTKEQMSAAIDRFKQWGNENGFYMPEPGDEQRLREIEIEIARQSRYL